MCGQKNYRQSYAIVPLYKLPYCSHFQANSFRIKSKVLYIDNYEFLQYSLFGQQ